jgi:four helix bundle protein
MRDFHKLNVWQKAHETVIQIYKATAGFPQAEIYGITSQIRRSGSSIPANIAEGCGRYGDAEFRRFLQIAAGSASELEYHLLLANDLQYLPAIEYQKLNEQVCEIKRMISSLIQKLKAES